MNKKINVLFKVVGSEKIGMGHVLRSLGLAREIQKNLETEVFFYSNPDKNVVKKIADRYRMFSNKDIVDVVLKNSIDILIIDQMEECIDLCKRLKRKKPDILIVALDYFNYRNEEVDVIINLYNHNLDFPNPRRLVKCYYEGLEYAIIRDSFDRYIGEERVIKEYANEILVAFGGADPCNNTIKILKLLNGIKDNFKVNIVIGPLFKEKDKILALVKDNKEKYKIYEDIANMEDIIFNTDLGFIGSGTTLMEFCALGTPAIVMPQNEREQRFARLFKQKGAIDILEKDYTNEEKIGLIKKIISSKEVRERMSIRERELIDGKGKERIKRIIMENYHKLQSK